MTRYHLFSLRVSFLFYLLTTFLSSVLKFADAVLKGYATAISVVLTGILSMVLFGTQLNVLYFLGIGNVICAVFLYSAKDLDRLLC
mmetsp:Transcript_18146/g.33763  ORF Transcript_18146/g.33763 Transcript_18146/m.33763 type:complete len:86 (+) Transcript_18146:106-363(+)